MAEEMRGQCLQWLGAEEAPRLPPGVAAAGVPAPCTERHLCIGISPLQLRLLCCPSWPFAALTNNLQRTADSSACLLTRATPFHPL
eukprot:1147064-Pelagomonas_calceolata.AAC.5